MKYKYILRVQPTRWDFFQFIYFYKTLHTFQTVFPSDKCLTQYVQFWAPDGGRKNRLKCVERLIEINKLKKVASCWLYTENILAMHRLTYLITPWCRVHIEKLTGLQLVKKFPAFHGTRRFITALASVRHLSLSWASPIQSIYPHPTSWRSILILSTHLHLGLPSGLLPSGFPSKTLYTPFSSPIRATCPAHLILLDFITRTILGEEYKSFSSSLYLPHIKINKVPLQINPFMWN